MESSSSNFGGGGGGSGDVGGTKGLVTHTVKRTISRVTHRRQLTLDIQSAAHSNVATRGILLMRSPRTAPVASPSPIGDGGTSGGFATSGVASEALSRSFSPVIGSQPQQYHPILQRRSKTPLVKASSIA